MGKKNDTCAAWRKLKHKMQLLGIDDYGQKKKLAAYLGVNPSQVTRWMKNPVSKKTEPSYSVGKRIEKYLKIPYRSA